MPPTPDELKTFLLAPRETLTLELKRWIDPKVPEGKAKIAKGCLALRNSGGGLFVVGFHDETGQPDVENVPADVRAAFHPDDIQGIVGEFAAPPFPVDVLFVERERQEYPVIVVPAGVQTPVAAKRELSVGGKVVIKDHAVYVRSLAANGTVSSSEPKRGDWERIVATWFENREADIGAFVRRHLGGLDLTPLAAALGRPPAPPEPTAFERAVAALTRGRKRFDAAAGERAVSNPGGFREAAIIVDREVPPQLPTAELLNQLSVRKPRHSGWSPWLISSGHGIAQGQQYVFEGGWEAILAFGDQGPIPGGVDFWRIDTRGEFYHLTALEDDFHRARGIAPGTQLDFRLQIQRVVEYITAARSFALTMGCDAVRCSLACAFRWNGLKNRALVSRRDPSALYYQRAPAAQDEVTTSVLVPLEVPPSGLTMYVRNAVRDLFLLFGGYEFEESVVEHYVRETLSSRY